MGCIKNINYYRL